MQKPFKKILLGIGLTLTVVSGLSNIHAKTADLPLEICSENFKISYDE